MSISRTLPSTPVRVPIRTHARDPVRAFTPHLRLYSATVLIDRGEPYREQLEDVPAALASLTFDYQGTRIPASDPRPRFHRSHFGSLVSVHRAVEQEQRVRTELERHGFIDTSCLDDFGQAGEQADYVVDLESDVDALATLGTDVLPRLRERGWEIQIDPSYPCQLAVPEAAWYGEVAEQPSWFSLELGILLNGERINLLPTLIDLIDSGGSERTLDELLSSHHKYVALPLGGKRYLSIPPTRLRQILDTIVELYDHERIGDAVALSEFDGVILGQIDSLLPVSWQGSSRHETFKRVPAPSPRKDGGPSFAPPRGLQATLRGYQLEGVEWMQRLRQQNLGGILADDMGLGKTLQAIAHILIEKDSGRMDRPSLVVAPTSLASNWASEIKKFAPSLRVVVYHGPKRQRAVSQFCLADVVITTYPLLVRDHDVFDDRDFHLAILDEAQAIKNPSSQVSAAAARLHARHRLCLSGTPVENSLDELWALFDFACPGYLGSRERFRTLYRDPIEKEGSEGRMQALRERVAPAILRRMKHVVAKELPPKTELVRHVELQGAQRDLYESIRLAAHEHVRKAVKDNGVAGSAIAILDALMKLRQVCCDPRLVKLKSAHAIGESAKYDEFFDMVVPQIANDHRVLVFSQFTSMLHLLSGGLREHGIHHLMLTGETTHRQRLVESFQSGDADLFLISLKAGGTGLNLTRADTVIHYDPWWNPASQSQATDRAYRIGQTRPVFAYNLVAAGSVEERIMHLQQRKRTLADNLLAPSGKSIGSLTSADVDDLFGPLD